MSTEFFNRQWKVEISGEEFISARTSGASFRVKFEIVTLMQSSSCTADFSFYNLSDTTAKKLFRRGETIRFYAGYESTIDSIFFGTIMNTFRDPDFPNTVTRVLCRGSEPVATRGTINATFGTNAKVVDMIKSIAKAIPAFLLIDESQFSDVPVYARGYSLSGDPYTCLDTLAHAHNFSYVQENGRLVVSRYGKTRDSSTLHTISQFTGMEGIPEIGGGPDGVTCDVSVRLSPKMKVNDKFKIESKLASFNTGNMFFTENAPDVDNLGTYNIFSITQTGDSHSSAWTTRLHGINESVSSKATNQKTAISWGRRVNQDFRVKVRDISTKLGIDASWLMACMYFETGGTFDPSTRNTAGSSATGLIQFTQATAVSLGTTTAKLATMTAVEQLDYVYAYLAPYKGRMSGVSDTYMAIFWPAAIGKADSTVLFSEGSIYYSQNAGLDPNHLGYVTKKMACVKVIDILARGQNNTQN